jgi:hypothetical protein
VLKVRRYSCKQCGADVQSRFLFDGFILDAGYFRRKMAESRQRKEERAERVRRMLAECRSPTADFPGLMDLGSVPGLQEALNGLTGDLPAEFLPELESRFDLKRYQSHILAHTGALPVSLAEMPSLAEDRRRDVIWRFVAAIFMAHAGVIDIWQDRLDVMVMRRETDRKGQELLACA